MHNIFYRLIEESRQFSIVLLHWAAFAVAGFLLVWEPGFHKSIEPATIQQGVGHAYTIAAPSSHGLVW